MRKKIIIGFIGFFTLIICYKIEESVYKNHTYSYYKNQREEKENKEQKSKTTETIQENVKTENKEQTEKQERKIAYLTFDDGPSDVTKEVLKVLKEYNIRATFFLIGNQITEDQEDVIKQMVEDGHLIGVHTYCHKKNQIYCSAEAYVEDFQKAYDRIYEVTGLKPTVFRFPWGSANNNLAGIGDKVIKTLEKEGFTYFDWNVSAEDSIGKPTATSILKNIRKDYKKYEEAVILMHDSSINQLTAQLLPQIIKMIKDSGYNFDTLDHMESPYQYPRD